MNHNMLRAFIVLIATIIISRLVMANAIKKLTDEEKAKLMSNKDINRGTIRLLVIFAALGLFYYLLYATPQYAAYLLWAFLALILFSRIYTFLYAKKRITQLQLPSFYLKYYTIASVITNVGLLLFLFLIVEKYLFQ